MVWCIYKKTLNYNYSSTEFVVHPSNRTVAPNSYASFNCVIRGDSSAYVRWKVNGDGFGQHDSEPTGVDATWYSHFNATLNISTQNNNGTIIQCKAVEIGIHKDSPEAILRVAGMYRAIFTDRIDFLCMFWILQVHHWNYTIAKCRTQVEYSIQFMPQFPILNYDLQHKVIAWRITK